MGVCRYCGESAGFLRNAHRVCREKHDFGLGKIPDFVAEYLEATISEDRFRSLLNEFAAAYFVSADELRQQIVVGLNTAVDEALSDRLLSDEEDARLRGLCGIFDFGPSDLGRAGYRLTQARILRELEQGRVPQMVQVDAPLQLNLARDETIVWAAKDVTYMKTRTRTTYVGGSQGVSIRLMKGVSYRLGSMKGEKVQTQYLSTEGIGSLIITPLAIYFLAGAAAAKIPLRKIMTLQPYADGLQIIRDASSPKPEVFMVEDAWFIATVVGRLSQM